MVAEPAIKSMKIAKFIAARFACHPQFTAKINPSESLDV
jgi:hypothetical protein